MAENRNTSTGRVADSDSTGQSGGIVHNTYLQRRQEFVQVNRSDLEDIQGFDASSQSFYGFGLFLVSGAAWLGAEKLLESYEIHNSLEMTPTLWLCVLCIAVGGFLIFQGKKMAGRKSSRIQRIFDETDEYRPQNKTIESARRAPEGQNRGVSKGA